MNYELKLHPQHAVVRLSGDLFDGIESTLNDLAAELKSAPKKVEFDLRALDRVNSLGVRQWLNFIRVLSEQHELRFDNAPVSFFGHALMMPGMLGKTGRVHSFVAPFGCEICKTSYEVLLNAKDVVAGKTPQVLCTRCSSPMTFEFDEGEDLYNLLAHT